MYARSLLEVAVEEKASQDIVAHGIMMLIVWGLWVSDDDLLS